MQDLKNKEILITGATDGIGKAAVTEFAKRGASITLVGRNKAKTDAVVAELQSLTGNKKLTGVICDLSKLSDVKRLAEEYQQQHDRLDILVNNAGATFKKPILGPDGYELTFTLNHLAYFQLTTSLLDLIVQTPKARIVSTSSSMQARGNIDLSTIATSLKLSGPAAYANSKLANVLFTRELQRRLDGTDVIANCFEPGMVRTQFGGFGSDQGFLLNFVYALAKPLSVSPEEGADSLIWLAASEEAATLKGTYVSKRKPTIPNKQALDSDLANHLWLLSTSLCADAKA